jgi:hypothetical protein
LPPYPPNGVTVICGGFYLRFVMSAPSSLDDLMRAAAAAGFALATDDDEVSVKPARSAEAAISVEDSARGARRPVTAAEFVAAGQSRADAPTSTSAVRAGANTVRDTVYGYLRMGVPA